MKESQTKNRQEREKKEEKEKRLVMWTGISFFMCLIVFLWILNIRNVFSRVDDSSRIKHNIIGEISQEFNQAFKEVKIKMEALQGPNISDETGINSGDIIGEKNITSLKEKLEATSSNVNSK